MDYGSKIRRVWQIEGNGNTQFVTLSFSAISSEPPYKPLTINLNCDNILNFMLRSQCNFFGRYNRIQGHFPKRVERNDLDFMRLIRNLEMRFLQLLK